MPEDPDFKDIPSEETIEKGRRSSLVLGLIIGGAVIAFGVIAYLIFGKYLVV